MSDRFYDWVVRKTQDNPGRTIIIGFIPAMIFVGHLMVTSIIDSPWLAIFWVPMVLLTAGLVVMMAKLANLNAHLEAQQRLEQASSDTSDPGNGR